MKIDKLMKKNLKEVGLVTGLALLLSFPIGLLESKSEKKNLDLVRMTEEKYATYLMSKLDNYCETCDYLGDYSFRDELEKEYDLIKDSLMDLGISNFNSFVINRYYQEQKTN